MAARRLDVGSGLALSYRRRDGFECLSEGAGRRLRLWGSLPPDWAGNLSLHAYAAGIQLVTGDAHRTRSGDWRASFLLHSHDSSDRMQFDFLNMARRAPRLVPSLPEPAVRISLGLPQESTGRVHARVRGRDSIGLVAHVLSRFFALGLQPFRFVLRTHADTIDDSFWLEPARGS